MTLNYEGVLLISIKNTGQQGAADLHRLSDNGSLKIYILMDPLVNSYAIRKCRRSDSFSKINSAFPTFLIAAVPTVK